MTAAPHLDERLVGQAQEFLARMRDQSGSLRHAVLLTEDGFEVARWPRMGETDGRIASMSSSIQALSEAIARELQMGSSEYVIIAAEGGHLIQMRVLDRPLVLAALFDAKELLGKALSLSRRTIEQLAAIEPTPAGAAALSEPGPVSQG